ncbi:MAG: hypothetical protein JW837_03720 [Sedimentisphaerales bacterium]|nr:hypothetical protein [Sedimentisphaerales bacterium]
MAVPKYFITFLALLALCMIVSSCSQSTSGRWPSIDSQCRPWTYWWWMGSAVDEENITAQLETFHKAGLGGVHIIPIYGAKGYEDRYIEYLSLQWMKMLDYTVRQAKQLGMGVDMSLGTGWCFGGPTITDKLANAKLHYNIRSLKEGQELDCVTNPDIQIIMAYGPAGQIIDLTEHIGPEGKIDWTAPQGTWQIYELWQKPSGRKVKRAAVGGEGHMLNPFYKDAIENYLQWFDKAFDGYEGLMPRAIYHDSYEYLSDWSPDLLEEFEKQHGYRLQYHLPEFFAEGDSETIARIKYDYRQTISRLHLENFTQQWVQWSRNKGCITRNEAHGSPANLLDIYAAADVPETEFFRFDRNPLIAKFASSAAHVAGHKYTSSETGTWLKEHFNVSLGHLRNFIDGLFVSGVNHVFYHGTCYSPADAPWPGWVFYASTQMNPRNSIWYDVDALNGYIARCQSVLQAGEPDNDILLYWPISDLWHKSEGMTGELTVHNTEWFSSEPIGSLASYLWKKGYAFDYISDRQIQNARCDDSKIIVGSGTYRTVLIPSCKYIPLETLRSLYALAEKGAVILFEQNLPQDVPGLGKLEKRRIALKKIINSLNWKSEGSISICNIKNGVFLTGANAEMLLEKADVSRETMTDQPGIYFIRRKDTNGNWYFLTNQDEQFTENPSTVAFDGWLTLARSAETVLIMDPMTGNIGQAATQKTENGDTKVYLQLEPCQSLILRTYSKTQPDLPAWPYYRRTKTAYEITGTWKVQFIQGGLELPDNFETSVLKSWTALGDENARRFAGTACYTIRFDSPNTSCNTWQLDLGEIASSAQVRLNGQDIGTVFSRPFILDVPENLIKPEGNLLEIEVTNLAANRIRDLDKRKVRWANFHDINFVNIDYKPFDASVWPLKDSGLLGPVRLHPLEAVGIDDICKADDASE